VSFYRGSVVMEKKDREFSIPTNPEDLLLLGHGGTFAVEKRIKMDTENESSLNEKIGGALRFSSEAQSSPLDLISFLFGRAQ